MLPSTCLLTMNLFIDLSVEEEQEFRLWAQDNYIPLSPIPGIWHPVIQDECAKINKTVSLKEDFFDEASIFEESEDFD